MLIEIIYAKGKKAKGCILDINRSGAGIFSTQRLRKNMRIDIVPESDYLASLGGKVVYCHGIGGESYSYKCGIKFISLSQKQKSALNKFISKLEKRKFFRLNFMT